MFGIAGGGKTTALNVLLRLAPPNIRCSTPLMKRPITVMFMCVNEKMVWEVKTPDQMCEIIAKVISSRVPKQHAVTQSDASLALPSHHSTTASHQLTSESRSTSTSEATGKTSEKHTADIVQSKVEVSLDSILKSTEMEDRFVSLVNSGPTFLEAIVQLKQLLIVDSGGRPEFMEMMPVFLNGASKFVYVMKAHEPLEKRTIVQYFQDNRLVWEFPAPHTNEDTLKQCICTMRSLNAKNFSNPPSKMMFLATHLDMVPDKELPGVLDHLHERLRNIFLPELKEQLIFCDSTKKDFVFTLNATKQDREAIRESLSKSEEGKKPVKVPLRWYALYQKLLEVMNGLGKKVLSREQCQQVAESMEIDNRSCEEALDFFNGLNMLFYFPAILPNLVFVEPQMLLDKVSELVDETYHMQQGKKLHPLLGERLKFLDYGQVTETFLSMFKSHYEPPLFTPKEFITLLKGLLVFYKTSSQRQESFGCSLP